MQVLKMGHLWDESIDFNINLINIHDISIPCHTKYQKKET